MELHQLYRQIIAWGKSCRSDLAGNALELHGIEIPLCGSTESVFYCDTYAGSGCLEQQVVIGSENPNRTWDSECALFQRLEESTVVIQNRTRDCEYAFEN